MNNVSKTDNKKLVSILLIVSQVFFLAFIVLIILLLTTDKDTIGPNDSVVGLSTINLNVYAKLGSSDFFYKLSNILGYLSFVIVFAFIVLGIIEWIKRKKLLEVDAEILIVGVFYIICLLVYVFFNYVVINYRPILEINRYGEYILEPSFPSSHTILGVFVFCSLGLILKKYINNKLIYIPLEVLCFVLGALMLVSRLLSGVHWFTDILGSFLLTGFLLLLFSVVLNINNDGRVKN